MNATVVESFAVGAARSVHPLVRSWYDDATLVDNCRAWLAPELRLVGDLQSARDFAAVCPVSGVAAEEYSNRVVRLDALDLVSGIRFRPSTGTFFVDLVVTSRPIADSAELAEIAREISARFARFSPRWMRAFVADERAVPQTRMCGDCVVAARVDDLRAAAASDSVTLTRRGAADVFDDYARIYADYHAQAPRNAELARVEDLETLQGWEKDGGVFEIRVDGARAGYCGAKRWSRYGVRGWCGAEIILAREFRGRGLAPSVHRRMAAAIDAAPGDALWADVHEDNAPSLKAGLRAGYAVIGRVLRVPI